jgi:hypothetical protein
MIADLPQSEEEWLRAFFGAPNELTWDQLVQDKAPELSDMVRPWLELLVQRRDGGPLVLPLMRGGKPGRWYATTTNGQGGAELASELQAWLGPSYLAKLVRLSESSPDQPSAALRARFGAPVFALQPGEAMTEAVVRRLAEFAKLQAARPPVRRRMARPVGRIRAEFDRALLAQDEHRAHELIGELRDTGRLNEENLRYLEVRMQAGLGYWPQVARNRWLVSAMADLALPPQILADVVEALYRTFIEDLEPQADASLVLATFEREIARPFPRLFSSRRGVRAPRVVKAFLLHERLQPKPAPGLTAELLDLLPESDRALPWVAQLAGDVAAAPAGQLTEEDADLAFDDAQYDRAFELYLAAPANKKSLNRLILCAYQIGAEAKMRLADWASALDPKLIGELSALQKEKLADLHREASPAQASPQEAEPANPWLAWAQQLKSGTDLAGAARALERAVANWDVAPFANSETLSTRFAELLGGSSGEAERVAREAVSTLISAFFPAGAPPAPALRPIAGVLFFLIALEDALSTIDLEVLAQLLSYRLALGLSSAEYVSMVDDLLDVQGRVCAYDTLPWSLDVCETLSLAPAASADARDARLRFFLTVLGQAQAFAHRLQQPDLVSFEQLAKDFAVDGTAIGWVRRARTAAPDNAVPDLTGKTIGIYTLAEAAGARAKAALEAIYPGCKVEVNSDLVCTARLTSLAKAADVFVFAWKSSSHQAFFCVKSALAPREPVWPGGKGTASILRAVTDYYT